MWIRAILLATTLQWLVAANAESPALKIGITPAILHDQYGLLADLERYLERKTGRPVELVPRNSYRQTIDLIKQGSLDYAWVSAYPYVYLRHHHHAQLLAVPLIQGRPYHRGYLIVPAGDQHTTELMALEGRFFAFADPYSDIGYLLPRHELQQAGRDPASFFAKTFYTWGHKKVVRAVASGLADGGYVDGFVWDALATVEPALVTRTRVVSRSAEYGTPPIVASRHASPRDAGLLRQALLEMASDPEGTALLRQLNIDRFVAGDPAWYAEVAKMMRTMGDL
jgi:phosphonate transport system substrate-binding protein